MPRQRSPVKVGDHLLFFYSAQCNGSKSSIQKIITFECFHIPLDILVLHSPTRYLDEHPDLPCAVSLRLLTLPPGREGAALVWKEGQGLALGPYCACHGEPRVWGEVLQFLLEQENSPTKHESVDSLLMAMAVALPPATLGPLLPPGEQFQSCLTESKKLQQAGRLQEVIIQTGRRLLDSLTL